MDLLIRKEHNGLIYIDKNNAHRFEELQMDKPPYNFIKISIGDIYSDCIGADFDDNLTFNYDKYNARKQKESENDYDNKIVALIRQRYNINQELAILRQRDTKPLEYQEYFDYVETCKAKVKGEL
jgi:hypothetical protein